MPDRPVPHVDQSSAKLETALVAKIGERKFTMWFGDGARCDLNGDRLRVRTRNEFVRDWISRHFLDELAAAGRETTGAPVAIEVVADPTQFQDGSVPLEPLVLGGGRTGTASDDARAAPGSTAHGRTTGPGSDRPSARQQHRATMAPRIDDLVVNEGNALAVHAARLVASAATDVPPVTLLVGGCGTGKSHLLLAIERERRAHPAAGRVRFLTAERFTNEFVLALRSGTIQSFRDSVRRLDLLLLDDLSFLANKTSTQAEFLHTLDALIHGGGRVVVTSDRHPMADRRLPQPLTNRLLAGVVAELPPPDLALRRRIAERECAIRMIQLPATALDEIAMRCLGGAREVRGVVLRLEALRRLDPGADLANAVTATLRGPALAPARRITLESILEVVADHCTVSGTDIRGSCRRRDVVDARGLVALLARELTSLSLPEIARGLGRDAHSTILQAAQRMRERCASRGEVLCGTRLVDARELVDRVRMSVTRPDRTGSDRR
ncbi:MAG: DnaA/Hda family protein [Planctomycetota bacterium]|nr:DnaA/Hda family protein [Planctomycetota bacterium]MDA1105518.1 DnaA/Hda family protein [Planctomycetota bacterium]